MAGCDYSYLPDGGEVGMTDKQFKSYLLVQQKEWQEVLDLAIKAGNTEIQAKAAEQIAIIERQLNL